MGIQLIHGVEINSFLMLEERRLNVHVLGYFFELERMESYLCELKKIRGEHNDVMAQAFRKLGIDFDYEQMKKQAGGNVLTRLDFSKMLVQKGYADSVQEALDKYLHKGGAAFVEYNFPPFKTTSEKIHSAGGIVSLAHPGEYGLNREEMEQLIGLAALQGADAVECIHPSQNEEDAEYLMELAERLHLAQTGGSDFHGFVTDDADLGWGGGHMIIPERLLKGLKVK